jgi:DNA-binding SARP family transcriptional activator
VEDGWISWPLAASLAAVATLVWLARRRRYRYTEPFTYPEDSSDGDDPRSTRDHGVRHEIELAAREGLHGVGRDAADVGRAEPDDDLYVAGSRRDEETARGSDGPGSRSAADAVGRDAADAEAETGPGARPLYWSLRHSPAGEPQNPDLAADSGLDVETDPDRQGWQHDDPDEFPNTARRTRRAARARRRETADLDEDADLVPMPAALNRIRMLVRAHGEAIADSPADTAGLQLPGISPATLPDPVPEPSEAESDAPAERTIPDPEQRAPEVVAAVLPAVGPSGAQLAGLADIPPEGIGLTGPGAEGAARALLVAVLSAGGPADPDAAGIVVTTFDALNALAGGPAAVNLAAIPRLQVAPDLDAAIDVLDDHILTRLRTLAEHDENDVQRLREEQPWSAPMPPVLLLAQAPPASDLPAKARLSTCLHLGRQVQIHGVLLGEWSRGETLTVDPTGHASHHDPDGTIRQATSLVPDRLAQLGMAEAVDLLAVLGEAQTGQPIVTTAPAPDPTSSAAVTSARTVQPSPEDIHSTSRVEPGPAPLTGQELSPANTGAVAVLPLGPGQERIRMRVLGAPMILDRDGSPVPGLRSGAAQLMTILAVHRDGHPLMDIMEKMWPDAQTRRAADRLSTEAANLRRTVRIALGLPQDRTQATNAVINTGSYYVLNETLLEVDLWQLQDLVNTAKDTDPAARIDLLRAAVTAHTGLLADGRDYPWADVVRHQIQRHGIRARLHLAQLLADDPGEAARIITEAADLDPVSEDLAQRAFRACATAGDAEGVRARLRALRAALEQLDQEPSADTLALAAGISVAKPQTSSSTLDRTVSAPPGGAFSRPDEHVRKDHG